MFKRIIAAAILPASLALAIGSGIVLDTVQPIPPLTRIVAWQGQSLTVIPTVRQDGQLYTNPCVVRIQYASNLTATAIGSVTGALVNGTATLTTPVLGITGRCVYVASVVDAGATNVLGAGVLDVQPTTTQGAWPSLPGVTFPELDPVFVAWQTNGYAGVVTTGRTITVNGQTGTLNSNLTFAVAATEASVDPIIASWSATGTVSHALIADVAVDAVARATADYASNGVDRLYGSNYITAAQVPAQTNQLYVDQAGTAQVAIVSRTVTGAQSQTIATAVQPAALTAYVQTNDARYLAALTNATAFDPAGSATGVSNALSGYLPLTGGTMSNGSVIARAGTISWGKTAGKNWVDAWSITPSGNDMLLTDWASGTWTLPAAGFAVARTFASLDDLSNYVPLTDPRYLITLTNGGPTAIAATNGQSLAQAIIATNATLTAATLESTGFEDCDSITVTYNHATRQVTLSDANGIYYWWRNARTSLGTSYTISTAAPNSRATWYLSSHDGTNWVWSTNLWAFSDLQVAQLIDTTDHTMCARETHGLQQWQTHENLHQQIGTYRVSGLGLGSYNAGSDTPADKTPSVAVGVIQDEDLDHTIPATAAGGPYTLLCFTGGVTGVSLMITNSPTLTRAGSGAYGVYNPFSGTSWSTNTELGNNQYCNYYFIHTPAGAGSVCQQYRTLVLQPQATFSTLTAAQSEDFRTLNMGDFPAGNAEWVPYARVTMQTGNSFSQTPLKQRIAAVSYLTYTRSSSVVTTGSGSSYLTANGVNGTNALGTIFMNGQATTIGTNSITTNAIGSSATGIWAGTAASFAALTATNSAIIYVVY